MGLGKTWEEQLQPGARVTPCLAAHMDMALVSLSGWRSLHVPRLPAARAPKASCVSRFGRRGIFVARRATAESRNRALQEELGKLELSFEDLDQADPLLYPAIRCCKAFVLPSAKALSVADQPGRAARVARDVARLVQQARVARQRWEATRATDRRPLVLLMDSLRSVQNVRALLDTCAACGAAALFAGVTPRPPMPQVMTERASRVPGREARSGREAVRRLQSEGYKARHGTSAGLSELCCWSIGGGMAGFQQVWALETTTRAKDLEERSLRGCRKAPIDYRRSFF